MPLFVIPARYPRAGSSVAVEHARYDMTRIATHSVPFWLQSALCLAGRRIEVYRALMNGPLPEHRRPGEVSDRTVAALGKLSEALEAVEVARGHLYAFHRLCGTGDLQLGEAVQMLRDAGHAEQADALDHELVGRNILQGRWSFQLVEEYDDTYYVTFKRLEQRARDQLVQGRRHLYEAEMKEARRTSGHPAHTAVPDDRGPQSPNGTAPPD